jgi:hypothetical protein
MSTNKNYVDPILYNIEFHDRLTRAAAKDVELNGTAGATSNPGTVQAHIDARVETTTYWQNDPKHNVDPTIAIDRETERRALQTFLNTLAF